MQIINRELLQIRQSQHRVSGISALQDNQFLLQNAEADLLERLQIITRDFDIAVHIGLYGSDFADKLRQLKIATNVYGIETRRSAERIDDKVALDNLIIANGEILPLKSHSVNLITASLNFQFINDLPGLLVQIKAALKPDGLLNANFIGGNSLVELRECLLVAETELTGGATQRVLPFVNVQQMGALLQRAGFALPVVDMDSLTVRYDHMFDLIKDLRAMGATNCLFCAEKPKALTRNIIARAAELYQEKFSQADGRIIAQFDVINLIGWSPHESQQQPLKPGSAKHNLKDFL